MIVSTLTSLFKKESSSAAPHLMLAAEVSEFSHLHAR